MLSLTNKSNLPPISDQQPDLKIPHFNYRPNWSRMEELAAKYRHIEKILIVGNGGSVNTFRGVYGALLTHSTPQVVFVDTNEPEFLKHTLESSDPQKTLLLSISKSGENVSQIEATLFLYQLPHKIFITGGKGALRDMAAADKNIDLVDHPDIGGRFTGFSEVNLLPSLLCGFDAHDFTPQSEHSYLSKLAWELASYLWEIEQTGRDQVLIYNYGQALNGFAAFLQQITHESFGKNGKGMTFVPLAAPEAQHHTSQRLFGGRQNVSLIFIKLKPRSATLMVPKFLGGVRVRDKNLADFDGFDLSASFEAEYSGVQKRADGAGIANITLELTNAESRSLGEYVMFWQMLAIYSAFLRGVDPYDQPDVEASKEISFKERFG